MSDQPPEPVDLPDEDDVDEPTEYAPEPPASDSQDDDA